MSLVCTKLCTKREKQWSKTIWTSGRNERRGIEC